MEKNAQYVACLYWALSTVSTIGYGDVRPQNNVERQYAVVVALIGVVLFAFSMGNINTLMGTTDGVRLRFEDKLRAVGEYMGFREADANLKRRLLWWRNVFCNCWDSISLQWQWQHQEPPN